MSAESSISVHFTFVRHGESEANLRSGIICGRTLETPLTQRGKQQAKMLGFQLRQEILSKQCEEYTHAFSSTALRTQETAQACFSEMKEFAPLELTKTPQVLEQSQGDWEGKMRDKIYQKEKVKIALKQNNWVMRPGDIKKGESQKQVADRMVNWVKDVASTIKSGRVLVFTHALAIKYLRAETEKLERSTAFNIIVENTSRNEMHYDGARFIWSEFNDTKHLKDPLLPYEEYLKRVESFEEYKKDMLSIGMFESFTEDDMKKSYEDYCEAEYRRCYLDRQNSCNDPGRMI